MKKQENIERQRLKDLEAVPVQQLEDQSNKQTFLQDKEAKQNERQRLRQLGEIEQTIEQIELSIVEKEAALCDPEVYQDHTRVSQLNTEIEQLKSELDTLMETWSKLEEE